MQRYPNRRQVNWAQSKPVMGQTENRIQVRFWVEFENHSKFENSEIAPIPVQHSTNTLTFTWERAHPHQRKFDFEFDFESPLPDQNPGPSSGPVQFLLFSRGMRMRCPKAKRSTPHHQKHSDTEITVAWPLHMRRTLRTHLSPRSHEHLPHAHARWWLRPRVSKYLTDFQYGRRFDSSYCCVCCCRASVSAGMRGTYLVRGNHLPAIRQSRDALAVGGAEIKTIKWMQMLICL